jgi:hypothetical protein
MTAALSDIGAMHLLGGAMPTDIVKPASNATQKQPNASVRTLEVTVLSRFADRND